MFRTERSRIQKYNQINTCLYTYFVLKLGRILFCSILSVNKFTNFLVDFLLRIVNLIHVVLFEEICLFTDLGIFFSAFTHRFEGYTSDAQHTRIGPVRCISVRAWKSNYGKRRRFDEQITVVCGHIRTHTRVPDGPDHCP